MLRCMCFAAGASRAIGQREECLQEVAIGDDEVDSPIFVQFEIGAVVRKKYRIDDEIRDFLRFGCFSLFLFLFILISV